MTAPVDHVIFASYGNDSIALIQWAHELLGIDGGNMGLKIVHDGSKPGDVQENCCMCRAPTRWWWGTGAQNVALCPDCAKTTKASELPTKKEWCAKERKLNPTLAYRLFGW